MPHGKKKDSQADRIAPKRKSDDDRGTQVTLRDRQSDSHFVVIRIQYPREKRGDTVLEPQTGYLIYFKPTMTGDEAVDLQCFARSQRTFPHDPTLNQFYDANKFESYRQLGFHIAGEFCDKLFPNAGEASGSPVLWNWTPRGQTGAETKARDVRKKHLPPSQVPIEVTSESLVDILAALEFGNSDQQCLAAHILTEQAERIDPGDRVSVTKSLLWALDDLRAQPAARDRIRDALEEIWGSRQNVRRQVQKIVSEQDLETKSRCGAAEILGEPASRPARKTASRR